MPPRRHRDRCRSRPPPSFPATGPAVKRLCPAGATALMASEDTFQPDLVLRPELELPRDLAFADPAAALLDRTPSPASRGRRGRCRRRSFEPVAGFFERAVFLPGVSCRVPPCDQPCCLPTPIPAPTIMPLSRLAPQGAVPAPRCHGTDPAQQDDRDDRSAENAGTVVEPGNRAPERGLRPASPPAAPSSSTAPMIKASAAEAPVMAML